MGMDVYGTAPTSKEGEYFRNNVWWWRPLADYICEVAPVIASECEHWHTNDGDGLEAADAIALAEHLQEEINSGRTAEFAMNYKQAQESLPRETCSLCAGTGIRTDAVGVANKMPERVITKDGHPRNGQTGDCNGCDGIGTREPWAAAYPFSVENVQEFVTFLKACGGFAIN